MAFKEASPNIMEKEWYQITYSTDRGDLRMCTGILTTNTSTEFFLHLMQSESQSEEDTILSFRTH